MKSSNPEPKPTARTLIVLYTVVLGGLVCGLLLLNGLLLPPQYQSVNWFSLALGGFIFGATASLVGLFLSRFQKISVVPQFSQNVVTAGTTKFKKIAPISSEERLPSQTLEQFTSDMIVVLDESGAIERCNPSLLQTLEYGQEDLVGQPFESLLADESASGPVKKLLNDATHMGWPLTLKKTSGASVPVLAVSVALEKEHALVVLCDKTLEQTLQREQQLRASTEEAIAEAYKKVDELSLLNEQRLEAEQRLVQSSRLSTLGEMASGIAHEIRLPLEHIQNTVHQLELDLKKKKLPVTQVKFHAKQISRLSTRIDKIVRGLRNYARDGSDDPFESAPVKRILDETLVLCQERLKKHHVALEIDEFPTNLKIECRETQISQMLLNLISNSFDAIENTDKPWIRIGVKDNDQSVTLSVTDSGKGIPKSQHQSIMQPFFTTKGVGKGTGLGLSITLAIAQAHQGQFYIDPQCHNTRFVIELPKHITATEKLAA